MIAIRHSQHGMTSNGIELEVLEVQGGHSKVANKVVCKLVTKTESLVVGKGSIFFYFFVFMALWWNLWPCVSTHVPPLGLLCVSIFHGLQLATALVQLALLRVILAASMRC